MPDARTIAVYDARAADYAALTGRGAPDAQLAAFLALLPEGAQVLDLGCGPGAASRHMADRGHRPDPVDASPGMVALARAAGLPARRASFDDLDAEGAYDAVWANFSLLHAPRADLPRHLAAVARALRPGGLLHIGMKEGEGEARDGIDRLYTYVNEAELAGLLTDAGLTVLARERGTDTGLSGTTDPWIVMRATKDG